MEPGSILQVSSHGDKSFKQKTQTEVIYCLKIPEVGRSFPTHTVFIRG